MFSIDQNCHSLWDTVPKLQALAGRGYAVRHFIEDVDVAFTSAGADADSALRLAREQYHRGGVADWGAALFYSEFLGRLPMDISRWEPQTGMKTAAAARKLGCTVDELYDEFSPSDNWQLIGPSYVGGRESHRVIGDLSTAETAPFVRELLAKARADCLGAFPQRDSQRRLGEWFDREQRLVEQFLSRCARAGLVDVYRRWLERCVGGGTALDVTSSLFSCRPGPTGAALLEVFLKDYDLAAGLYNEAIAETDVGLHPLKTADGELPFFATLAADGHLVRVAAHLDGNEIRIGRRSFALPPGRKLPLARLEAAGVRCLAGKAALLVIQVRLGAGGDELALPHRGSPYVPASHRLAAKLRKAKLLSGELRPIVRVRFRLLDRLRDVETVIRLPEHLRPYFGADEVPARALGENHAAMARQAAGRLESFRDAEFRRRWQRDNCPAVFEEVEQLERQRRQLARSDPKSELIRGLGRRQKNLQVRLFRELFRQIARDAQAAELGYWDSRGALLPWCVALGGAEMYNDVLARAEIRREPDGQQRDG